MSTGTEMALLLTQGLAVFASILLSPIVNETIDKLHFIRLLIMSSSTFDHGTAILSLVPGLSSPPTLECRNSWISDVDFG